MSYGINVSKSKTILITGSTDGIGKELALSLANKDFTLIVHGRNQAKGQKLITKLKAKITYGYITKKHRIEQALEKSHMNDAFVIAKGNTQVRSDVCYRIKQVRKSNRKLFRGARSHIRNTAPRFIERFQRWDKVLFEGIICYIFGRRKTGYFDVRTLIGKRIHASAHYKKLQLLESARTFLVEHSLIENKERRFLPDLKVKVSTPSIR